MSVNPYLWITIVGGIVAFLMGAGLGANDLANAFGTTYGAKILKLWQICILASICEFAGAVSLGGAVTSTISGGITDPAAFADKPYVFMYGMLCASGAAFTWLALATWLVLPVSSTHSVCGGVIGFGLVYGGAKGVKWASPQSDFPFVGGVVPIIASWFISPVLTGVVTAFIYGMVRLLVLRPKNSVSRAIYSLPIVVGVAFFLESFFVLFKGAKNRLHWSVERSAWVAACIGAVAGGIACIFIPILFRRLRKIRERNEALAANTADAENDNELVAAEAPYGTQKVTDVYSGAGAVEVTEIDAHLPTNEPLADANHAARRGPDEKKMREEKEVDGAVVRDENDSDADSNEDASEHESESEGSFHRGAKSIRSPGDRDEPRAVFSAEESADGSGTASGLVVDIYASEAEYVYRYLQIFTAVCASFAHGASDVSNAAAPFAAIVEVYFSGSTAGVPKMEVPVWILCIGAGGIVLGLSTFGIRLMRLLGEKITVITPSRGFSAELAAALVVSFASGYGIPVSSTHCITGAVVAVSIVDVGFTKIRWLMILKMYAGWVFTLVFTALLSAVLFAQGVYTPNV